MNTYCPPPSSLPAGSVVWAYVRDNGVADNYLTTTYQLAEIEAYCALHGLHLAQVFVDEGLGGFHTKNRPGFLAMFAQISDPALHPQAVLVYDLSRFGRNSHRLLHYIHCLTEVEIKLFSLMEGEGYRSSLLSLFDLICETVRKASHRKGISTCVLIKPQNLLMKTPLVLGYRKITAKNLTNDSLPHTNQWQLDLEVKEIIETIFSLFAQGIKIEEITEVVNNRYYHQKGSSDAN